jgi:hypothetical protein
LMSSLSFRHTAYFARDPSIRQFPLRGAAQFSYSLSPTDVMIPSDLVY